MEVEERDPEQLYCANSSSCRRSCVQIFIIVQLIVIFILSLCLKSMTTNSSYEYYDIDYDTVEKTSQNSSFNRNSSSWIILPDKMERLNENPVYRRFNISKRNQRQIVSLLLIVSSAPNRGDRRTAIRETWWQECVSQKVKVKCLFMTDAIDNSTSIGKQLMQESVKYQDMEFQHLHGGVEFGKRFLYHMIWAMQNYKFDYFMRLDDDYFFCLKRFLIELPLPMLKMYHWGYVHCVELIVRPEESIIMLSRDLIETFLGQDPEKILCHPWADQMIALWVQALQLKKTYNHDKRLHHDPPISKAKDMLDKVKDVCKQYIGLHGSYPDVTRKLWNKKGKEDYLEVTLNEFTVKCDKRQLFKWDVFIDVWRYKPKLCINNPKWDTYAQEKGKGVYVGRQGA